MSHASTLSRTVARALAIFGGVQVAIILCQIARTKMIAVWIGPVGVGLFALYNQAYEVLCTLFQLNLRQSAVRDIAAADTPLLVRLTVLATRRWALLLGIVGAVATACLAPWLSRVTFGDTAHTWAFCVLAALVLISSLTAAQLAVLQGRGLIKALARASMWGIIAGVAVAAPMFYFWRIDSIIPAMAVFVTASCVAALCQRSGAPRPSPLPSWRRSLITGRPFIVLGVYITVSAVLTTLSVWVFSLWLHDHAGTHVLGLYQAGYTLVGAYVGLIFTAISMEYYPRLAACARMPRRSQTLVSHETALALWVLMPVICAFVAADQWIMRLLYSADFAPVTTYLTIGIGGVIFRAVSWCQAFEILARGDGRIYIVTEGISAAAYVGLGIGGYLWGGLLGLGIMYVVWYCLYALVVGAVYRWRYGMRLGRGVGALVGLSIAVAAVAIAGKYWAGWWFPAVMAVALVPVAWRKMRL